MKIQIATDSIAKSVSQFLLAQMPVQPYKYNSSLIRSVDKDPGVDGSLELDSDAVALAMGRSGSGMSEAFGEMARMLVRMARCILTP